MQLKEDEGKQIEQQREEEISKDINFYLHKAESWALKGNLDQAAQILIEALKVNPEYAHDIAGFPYYDTFGSPHPASGYGLLVHLAGKMGNKQLAIQYLKGMLELNIEFPGDRFARQAARGADVEKETKKIARGMGVS